MVVGTPQRMHDVLVDVRRLRQRQIEQTSSPADAPDSNMGLGPEDLVAFSEEILDAATVAVVYDEAEGIHYFADLAAVLEPFAVPAEQLTPALLSRLRDYLNDETVPPFLFRRLAAQHPDSVDHVFATLLGKKDFRWDRDGEALLTRKKPAFAGHEPAPSITGTGKRLAELLRAEHGPDTSTRHRSLERVTRVCDDIEKSLNVAGGREFIAEVPASVPVWPVQAPD